MSASTQPPTPTTITLRGPIKYKSSSSSSATPAAPPPPPLAWLHRTWTVTHSTLSMWRDARNVRITYAPMDPHPNGAHGRPRLDDLVEYEGLSPPHRAKSIRGFDTAVDDGDGAGAGWLWRGRGWMCWITSSWEVLGWGERPLADGSGTERWVVTWFAPTLFTSEGVDIYSDRAGGGSKELSDDIIKALASMEARPVADLCVKGMRAVAISVSPKEGS